MESVRAYGSQFHNPDSDEKTETYISSPEFYHALEGRAREFGKCIGAKYGEGYTSKKLLGVDNLFHLR